MNVNFTKPPSVLDKDPYFNNVSLLMHMNGISGSKNFVDSSANNIQSTAIGNIEVSSARTRFGNGAAFLYGNGAGNYIRVSGNPNLAVGTGDYTLEMWAYVSSDSPFVIFDAAPINSPGSRPDAFLFYIENTRQPRFFGGGISIITPVASFPIDQWAHLALVRNTGTTTIYINGTGISNSTGFYNATIATGGCLIGGFADNLNFTSNGYIDELRLTKGVARYTGNFTPPTTEFPDSSSQPKSLRFLKSNDGKKTLLIPTNTPLAPEGSDPFINNVALLLHMDGSNGSTNFIDSSINNFSISRIGNTEILQSIKKFGSGAGYFDGSGDYLDLPLNSAFDFGADNFTIEFWLYHTTTNFGTYVARWGGGGNAFYIGGSSVDGIAIYINDPSPAKISGGTIQINQWNHIAIVRNGTEIKAYINGSQVGDTFNIGTNSINSSPNNLRIGRDHLGNPFFQGYMDEIRITKGVARYTSIFTPPGSAFPDP